MLFGNYKRSEASMLAFPSYPVILVQGDIWDPESTQVGSQAEVGIWYRFGPTRLGAGIEYGSESVPSRSRGNTTGDRVRLLVSSVLFTRFIWFGRIIGEGAFTLDLILEHTPVSV